MNELKFIDTPELKFHHTAKGVIAKYKRRKFILGTLSISHENISFTEEDYLNLSQTVLDFESSVRGFPKHQLITKKLISSTNLTNDYSPFYKYVKPSIFNYFILKGKWQLGNIHQYRTIENINQRDEFEGYSFLNLNINNHMVSQVCNSGFNYLIFCGTKSNNSTAHKEQFGQKELYFPDPKSFAESICKSINAKRYFIQNVEYRTLKSYVRRQPIINPNIKINHILTPPYFDILAEHMLFPSLFVKPESFEVENEVRVVFEMEKDHFRPFKFNNKSLLEHIKY